MNTQKAASASEMTDKVLQEMDKEEGVSSIQLPSALQPNQLCHLAFRAGDPALTATVCGVHFYIGKVKYDLRIMLDGDMETRIYNVDSVFVTPA